MNLVTVNPTVGDCSQAMRRDRAWERRNRALAHIHKVSRPEFKAVYDCYLDALKSHLEMEFDVLEVRLSWCVKVRVYQTVRDFVSRATQDPRDIVDGQYGLAGKYLFAVQYLDYRPTKPQIFLKRLHNRARLWLLAKHYNVPPVRLDYDGYVRLYNIKDDRN